MNDQLFFSRAILAFPSTGQAASSRGATRSYIVHQLVADLFGEFEERPFLYRSEGDKGASEDVLILSETPPISTNATPPRPFGIVRSVSTRSYWLGVASGTLLDFEIRLNATKDLPQGRGNRSRRVDVWDALWKEDRGTSLTPHEVYAAYLRRRLDGAATMVDVRVVARGMVQARRDLERRSAIRFVAADVIGTLRVMDAAYLQTLVAAGIGRSKAFGCGLLCLSRPGSILLRRYPTHALTG